MRGWALSDPVVISVVLSTPLIHTHILGRSPINPTVSPSLVAAVLGSVFCPHLGWADACSHPLLCHKNPPIVPVYVPAWLNILWPLHRSVVEKRNCIITPNTWQNMLVIQDAIDPKTFKEAEGEWTMGLDCQCGLSIFTNTLPFLACSQVLSPSCPTCPTVFFPYSDVKSILFPPYIQTDRHTEGGK